MRLARVTYQGFRTDEGWEIVVKRSGQPLRLLEVPPQRRWALSILKDYLRDEARAADLHQDFEALTIRRFAGDWEMNESEIEDALLQIEVLRMRWRLAMARA